MYSIVLIENHSFIRMGIQSLIEKSDKFFVKETYESGDEGLKAIKELEPDFAIIDLSLPDLPGEFLIQDLFLNDIKTKIIVLTRQKYIPQIVHLLKMNISAYIIKDSAGRDLLTALDEALLGKVYLSPSIEKIVKKMGYIKSDGSAKKKKGTLTQREIEVARMLSQGVNAKEIASQLSISLITVRVHIKNILKKLELENLKEFQKISDDLF